MRRLLLTLAVLVAAACNATDPSTDSGTPDDTAADTGDTEAAPVGTLLAPTAGGGTARTANHAMEVVVGTPASATSLRTANHDVVVGVGTVHAD